MFYLTLREAHLNPFDQSYLFDLIDLILDEL